MNGSQEEMEAKRKWKPRGNGSQEEMEAKRKWKPREKCIQAVCKSD
ncbi:MULTISPECIES: hypothetical protein [unclassified Bartonella]